MRRVSTLYGSWTKDLSLHSNIILKTRSNSVAVYFCFLSVVAGKVIDSWSKKLEEILTGINPTFHLTS